jgi:hypothetical protein
MKRERKIVEKAAACVIALENLVEALNGGASDDEMTRRADDALRRASNSHLTENERRALLDAIERLVAARPNALETADESASDIARKLTDAIRPDDPIRHVRRAFLVGLDKNDQNRIASLISDIDERATARRLLDRIGASAHDRIRMLG